MSENITKDKEVAVMLSPFDEEVVVNRSGHWHRGVCGCGWRGVNRGSKRGADRDSFEHVYVEHPGTLRAIIDVQRQERQQATT